jgi:hypothetical protein
MHLNNMKIGLSALSLSLVAIFPAAAQTSDSDRIKALEDKFNQSLSVIEQLQKRIAELEQHPATAAPAATAGPEVSNRVETLEQDVAGLQTSVARIPTDTGIPIHGFIDVDYSAHNGNTLPYQREGFRLGTFDLYMAPQIGDHVKGLVEVAFEYPDYGSASGVLGTDLERLQLGYTVNDSLTVWGGRFHTPYGYWNTAFHHGAEIQTSINRPRFVAFEDQGGILPAHTVGAWATGKLDTAAGRLNYDLYAGNSDSMRDGQLDYNAVGFDEASPTVGFRVSLSPKAAPELVVGFNALQEKVDAFDSNVPGGQVNGALIGSIGFQMLGAFGYYESDNWEIISEYYRFNNTDLYGSAGTNQSWAGFAQAGYHLAERLTGFGRYEKAALNQNDPYFALMNGGNQGTTFYGSSYYRSTVGLRYDLDQRASVKLQWEQMVDDADAGQTVNWLRMQYAVRF